MRKHRKLVLGAALLSSTLLVAACGGNATPGGDGTGTGTGSPEPERGAIAVGVSGPFAESQLVAEMYAQVLENAGYEVVRQLDLGSREVSDEALFSGEIDVKPEYLAFELPKLDESADTTGTADEVYPRVKTAAEANELVALEFSPANSTNVFVVTPEKQTELGGITTMTELGPVSADLVIGVPPDCPTNPACEEALRETYGIEAELRPLDFGGAQTVTAIDSDAVDVGQLFSLDPTITQKGYVVLEDDQETQPAGNFFALIRQDAVNDEVEELLNSVTTALTTDGMLELVGRVQVDQEDVGDVATDFLTQEGLL